MEIVNVIARYHVAMRTATVAYPFRALAGCKVCDDISKVAPGFGCSAHRA